MSDGVSMQTKRALKQLDDDLAGKSGTNMGEVGKKWDDSFEKQPQMTQSQFGNASSNPRLRPIPKDLMKKHDQ